MLRIFSKKDRFSGRFFSIILLAVLFFVPVFNEAVAQTFMCTSNPDYFSKRCTIHPYAVTKVVDGVVHKGHLAGCQFKSYTCMDGLCRDNFGTAQIPFNFSMDDLKRFCTELCKNPPCSKNWE